MSNFISKLKEKGICVTSIKNIQVKGNKGKEIIFADGSKKIFWHKSLSEILNII